MKIVIIIPLYLVYKDADHRLTWNALGRPDNIIENSGGLRLNKANNTDCAD